MELVKSEGRETHVETGDPAQEHWRWSKVERVGEVFSRQTAHGGCGRGRLAQSSGWTSGITLHGHWGHRWI